MSKIQKLMPFAALVLAGSLALTGCSGSAEPAEKTDPAPTKEVSETPEPTEESPAAAAGDSPVWFAGALDEGEQIGEGSTDSWSIKVYEVGTGEADKDSMFVDPDTNENVLPAGTEVVFLNFVYTNTSDAAIDLSMIPDPSVRSANWPFMQGQPGVSTASVYEAKGLSSTGYDVTKRENYDDPYTVEPGQSIAIATSIKYEAGVDATAKPSFIPRDAKGDLLHDEKQQAEITFKMK